MPAEDKVRLIDALSRTGLARIEAVSFVHPAAIPQMADADRVWAEAEKHPGIRYSALAPNLKGVQRALDAGFAEVEVVVSASATHNRANVGRSTEESVAEFGPICELAHEHLASVEAIIATSFGCPYEGDVDPARVAAIVDAVTEAGADRIAFGDTTGMATPRRVDDLLDAVDTDLPVLMHFHNTRGTALANVLTALERASPSSTRASAASADAPTRPAPPATSPPKRSCTCCTTWGSTPASTSTRSSPWPRPPRTWSAAGSTPASCGPAPGRA
ncbi:hypothetical protein GCM10029992_10860 [Glycomyces albus]